MSQPNPESQRLDQIAQKSLYAAGLNACTVEYAFQVLSRFFRGQRVLEVGPAEGIMTELLVKSGLNVTVVEGAELFCVRLKEQFPKIQVVHSLFEDFQTKNRFDTIILSQILEHVADPVDTLRRASTMLAPSGVVVAAVPNSRSLHRQAAVLMRLLPSADALNEMDRHHGHRRVFNPESFRQAFLDAGLRVQAMGGFWLKPLSNAQIEQTWTRDLVAAYMQLGESYPDLAALIYIVAGRDPRGL